MVREDLPRFRQVRRRVGVFVLVGLVVFALALLQAGVLRDLLRTTQELKVLLPETGPAGLATGSDVQILGANAGRVEKIVLDPDATFHAIVEVDHAMEPFIRRDSKVVIRKQFGIAGAAFLEISRGRGAPLDWDFAVLSARADADPTENVGQILQEVQARVLPVIDLAEQVLGNVAVVTTRLATGQGALGRLLEEDILVRDLEASLAAVNQQLGRFDTIMADLQATTASVQSMAAAMSSQSEALPEMVQNSNQALVSLNQVMAEVGEAMPEVTRLVRETSDATASLPTLLTQTQQTLGELEQLLVQIQGTWLFGGGGQPAGGPGRMSPLEARP